MENEVNKKTDVTTPVDVEKKKFYPNVKQAWILLLWIIPITIAMGVVLAFPTYITKKAGANTNDYEELIMYVLMFGILIAIGLNNKRRRKDTPYIHYKNHVSIIIYLLLVPLVLGFGFLADTVSSYILPEMSDDFRDIYFSSINTSFASVLSVVVAAPIFEELLMRGIILEGLLRNTSPTKAIAWSAFMFAVLHLNIWQGFSAFFIGCLLGWVYYKTRSIIPCIFIHFVNNGIAMASLFYCEQNGISFDAETSEVFNISDLTIIIVGAVIFAASAFLLKKQFDKKEEYNKEEANYVK